MSASVSRQTQHRQIAELTERLREAEEALAAIREGDVDAILVSGNRGEQVFSLAGSDSVYRNIVESMQEAALTATRDGTILFSNAQFSTMLKFPLETMVGRRLADLVADEDRSILSSILQVSESKPFRGRICLHGASAAVPVLVSASLLPQQDGPCVCLVVADLSELEASAAALRHSNGQLRRLAGELVRAEERERRRLASLLHDDLQQLLVGARYQIDGLTMKSGEAQSTAQRVAELLDQSITTSRSLATEISPSIRFGSGLGAAFEWLAASMRTKHSLAVRMTVRGPVDPVAEEVSIILFRSVQELLLNVIKHAGVKTADLRVEADEHHLRITVSDEGRGFDSDEVMQATGIDSFGLFSVSERLGLMGGRMEILSTPGKGSSFTLEVPISNLRPGDASSAAARGANDGSPARARSACPEEDRQLIRILAVDDHNISREGVILMLSRETGIRIVGECADGETAIRLAGELEPDVILMDVSMPGMNGIEATRVIHEKQPQIQIIGLSMYDEAAAAHAMKEAGAVTYVSKSGSARALMQAIRAAGSLKTLADGGPEPAS